MSVPLLQGVRVLDLTNVLAGPFAGYQLALLGADVLKVENPHGGDLARQLGADPDLSREQLGASFLAQNAGKRSIALDLKDQHDRTVFSRLVADYDIILENFRPGVMDRLGFGWDAVRTINPSVIYCAVSGFGQTGPMRERPAYDQIIQGLSGLMSVTGTKETSPMRVGVPICDSIGGYVAAFAMCAALVRRAQTGEGAFLDVSMLDAAIASMGWVVSDQLIAGRDPRAMANENPTSAPSGTFDTADGKLNIAANKQEQFEALCGVLGRQELLADPRFAVRESRKLHRDELREELEKSSAPEDRARVGRTAHAHRRPGGACRLRRRSTGVRTHPCPRADPHRRLAVRARRHAAPARQSGPGRRRSDRTRLSATGSRCAHRRRIGGIRARHP